MRWIKKQPVKRGDTRIESKFLIFPKCINGEYRWLEKVKYLQEYTRMCYYEYCHGEILTNYYLKWKDIEWIDD